MKKDYPSLRLVDRLRDLSYWPGLLQLKHAFRRLQALVHHAEFWQLRQLVTALPLETLLARPVRHTAMQAQPQRRRLAAAYRYGNAHFRGARHPAAGPPLVKKRPNAFASTWPAASSN